MLCGDDDDLGRDHLLNECYTHTWMCYVPGLPRDLDYPEVLAISAPNPVLVFVPHFAVWSPLPVARRFPSGLKATLDT
jgi:hypothetical protein